MKKVFKVSKITGYNNDSWMYLQSCKFLVIFESGVFCFPNWTAKCFFHVSLPLSLSLSCIHIQTHPHPHSHTPFLPYLFLSLPLQKTYFLEFISLNYHIFFSILNLLSKLYQYYINRDFDISFLKPGCIIWPLRATSIHCFSFCWSNLLFTNCLFLFFLPVVFLCLS